jgi:uncharacterized surface protein with fasciclin (FAS1) repeats
LNAKVGRRQVRFSRSRDQSCLKFNHPSQECVAYRNHRWHGAGGIREIHFMSISTSLRGALTAAALLSLTAFSQAQMADKTVVENAVASKDHTTLVAAVTAAGLGEALSGAGPFTVFAPTNDAFGKLPAGTVDTLLKPENKAALTKVLTSHVVAGNYSAADIIKHTKNGMKRFNLTTLSGAPLTFELRKSGVWVYDQSGGAAKVVAADLAASNGVIHVTNAVSLPK